MRKIIYIGYMPITAKASDDFFITQLINDGAETEYWDLTNIYFPKLQLHNTIVANWIKPIDDFKQFNGYLNKEIEASPIFIINFPFYEKVYKVFQALTVKKATIYIIAKGMIPLPPAVSNITTTTILSKINPKKIAAYIGNKICLINKKMGLIKPFDRIYFAGADAMKIAGVGHYLDQKTASLIEINSSDFDKYMDVKNNNALIEKEYVVFLDEYFPYHPDFEMLGIKTISPTEYYAVLNEFFYNVEKKYNVAVVIAAHPKAKLYQEKNFFEGREVFFNKTAELVQNAKFVLAHLSTSISFAILFKKSILFFYTDEMLKVISYQVEIIKYFAEVTGSPFINISLDATVDIKPYDAVKYDTYKYNYLTSKATESSNSYTIFKQSLQ